jgi:hypothetical protein
MMMMMAPEIIPAEPNPAMARPTMNTVELGAAPQSAEPTSKMAMAARKTHFGE